MNSKYEVIVFDLGNVLLPFSYTGAIEKINQKKTGLGDKFWKFYLEHYEYHRSFERGDIPVEDFIFEMLKVLEGEVNKEEFCNLYSKVFTENIPITSLLPELKMNYRLVLLSNTNEIHREYGWGEYKFLENFEKLILSHEVNAVKPEAKIYNAVEEFTKVEKGKHIFIDDVKDYVTGAKNAGWDGIQYISPEQLIAEFKEREII